jgi:hypothetical protein
MNADRQEVSYRHSRGSAITPQKCLSTKSQHLVIGRNISQHQTAHGSVRKRSVPNKHRVVKRSYCLDKDLSTVSTPAPPPSTSDTGASAYSSASSTKDSTFDSGYSTTLQISSSTLATPTAHLPSKPGLSPAATAGVSIVSIVVLASIIVAVFFLSRRFRRSRYGRAETPPPYVPETNKDMYFPGKSELDAQYSEVGVRTPVGHVELDGASPFIYELDGASTSAPELDGASRVNPMRGSALVSASEKNAEVERKL